jgi:phage terminase large subunit-like protein
MSGESVIQRVAGWIDPSGLTPDERELLAWSWRYWARPEQIPPPGHWTEWVYLAGRASGKSRAAAEWLLEKRRQIPGAILGAVGATLEEVRKVMVDGESGLLACCPPWEKPHWNTQDSSLDFADGTRTGARIFCLTAENPEQPRGFQFHAAWLDEVAKWRKEPLDTYANVKMATRLGELPQMAITTTPRPCALLRKILSKDALVSGNTVVSRGRTMDNRANLARGWLQDLCNVYGGTRLGRQELEGELFDEAEGALWSREWIDRSRIKSDLVSPSAKLAWLAEHGMKIRRIVLGIDPSTTSKEESDECGISVCGTYDGNDGLEHVVVLADETERLSPLSWAKKIDKLVTLWGVDMVVAETTMGGETIPGIINSVNPAIRVKEKGGNRGKCTRAEPVAAVYERGRVHHFGQMNKLEDEMLTYTLDTRKSPNALDALVYAVGELILGSPFFIV